MFGPGSGKACPQAGSLLKMFTEHFLNAKPSKIVATSSWRFDLRRRQYPATAQQIAYTQPFLEFQGNN